MFLSLALLHLFERRCWGIILRLDNQDLWYLHLKSWIVNKTRRQTSTAFSAIPTQQMKSNRYGQSRVLDTNQLDLLISNLPDHHHQVVAEVCRRTGCRVGEATQLTWGMISESAITFQRGITKGKLASRSVPVTPALWEALRSWRAAWVVRQGVIL